MDWVKAERAIIHKCILDKISMGHAAAALGGYQFVEKATEWIWNHIREVHQDTGEPPTFDQIWPVIDRLEAAKSVEMGEELLLIRKTTPEPRPKAALGLLQERSRTLATMEAMERATESFTKGDSKAGIAAIEKVVKSKAVRPGLVARPLFPKKFRIIKSKPRIPTGLYSLDQIIGGTQRGESNLILGATGVGKSALCTELAHAAMKTGHRVLYLDTENGEHIIMSRFYARMARIEYELVEQNRLSADKQMLLQKWLDRNHDRLSKLMRYVHVGFVNATIGQVEATIQETMDGGFRPDLIIFDSPDHLIMNGTKDAARWENFADMANQIKAVAERADASMWSTSQVSGENIEQKIATTAHAADSKQKAKNAAIAISVNRRIDPKTKQPMGEERDLYIAKNRNGPGQRKIALECQLNFMTMKAPPMTKGED